MRIGVLGGSFDPVHVGHLMLAENARIQAGLSRVLFMPTSVQPFKQDIAVSSDDERIMMLGLALRTNPYFQLTYAEIERGGISYTIDSLRQLREEFVDELNGDKLAFILGSDMFLMIEKWKLAEELLAEFAFLVAVRPGYAQGDIRTFAASLREKYGAVIDFIDNSPIELASSDIRSRLEKGIGIRYLVPEDVRRFLLVRAKESESRFAHTKRVMEFAAELADCYGADSYKAIIASLLHDYCKDGSGETENNLTHGALAADAAEAEFGVFDDDILNAIRYHTTGRAHMSDLEMIVFVADTLAPGRSYKEAEELRSIAKSGLKECTLTVLLELERYLETNGYECTDDSKAAIAWLQAGCA